MKHSFNRVLTYINRLPDLNGRTIIVTGANSGIGFELCKIVAIKKGRLIMAVRNVKKGEKAKEKILKVNKDTPIEIEQFDQTDFKSINRFVTRVRFLYPNFHALIVNAGVLKPEKGLTTGYGYPLTSATNLFGASYMIKELEKLLKGTIEHKIIIQGSLSSRVGKYKDFESAFLNPYKGSFYQYNMSKIGLYNMFRHFVNYHKNGVIYGWCEPGIAGTDILRHFPTIIKTLGKFLVSLFIQTPLQAALPAAYMMCENFKNGTCVAPNGLWHISGLPKVVTFNDRHTYYSLPKKIIDSIYEKQMESNSENEIKI